MFRETGLLCVFSLALGTGGCSITNVQSQSYYPNGQLKSSSSANYWEFGTDQTASRPVAHLADGTYIKASAFSQQPDAATVAAVQALVNSFIALGKLATPISGL
jgi:hypothetical protein